ncbi:hypothetical protein [Scytonema sp. UIC 10036]|nr:hypothetical protein [Scytonema sp. UIC 10036]
MERTAMVLPFVSEKLDLELTTVALPMISLIPEEVERKLKAKIVTLKY